MVGAATALVLARKGFSVALIERQPVAVKTIRLADEFDLRVSAISPASQQLLDELGVWSMVRSQRSCDYQKMFVWHQNGSSQLQFASEQIGVSHLGTIVENRIIQSILLQQLNVLPNVTLLSSQQLESIQQSQTGVQLTTSSDQILEAELLIAADGRESTVRQLLNLPISGGSYKQTAIVANVTTEQSHENTAWQRFLTTGPLAFLPLSNGQSSIVWSADCTRAEELLQLSDDDFNQQLSEAFEYRLGAVTASSARAGFPLNWHSAGRWLEGRVLLVGDAAHGVHPLAGQGVNLGFGDVALLSRLLTTGQPVFHARLLRRFERQRKAETVAAMHLFSVLKSVYGQHNRFICKLRDIGMTVIEKNRLIKRLVMHSALQNMS